MPRDHTDTSMFPGLGGSEPAFALLEVLQKSLAELRPVDLQPGDVLIRQADASEWAFFLESGSLLVYSETRYGPVPLATIQGPRLVGEIGALAEIARTASVEAATSARVYEIDRARLVELARQSPELLVSAVRQLGRELESMNKAIALYTNALAALERRDFDAGIFDDLAHASPQLPEFSAAFARFADQITSKRRSQDELAGAALIQKSFLPKEPMMKLAGSGVAVQARMRPAREVGGDFYDYFMLDADRMVLVIGDVCGKGIPASLFMAVVVTSLRTAAREEADVSSTIARANARLCRDNAASMFATTFYGVLNLQSGLLEYCNCGHNAPLHLPAQGEPRELVATALPLGMLADRPMEVASVELARGDDLVLFTDGVTEATNPANEELGDNCVAEVVSSLRGRTPAEVVSGIFEAVDRFAHGAEQADDITCVLVRRRDLGV